MKIKTRHLVLIAIFIFSLSIRCFFAFQTEYFSDSESYYNLRQIENIKNAGLPIYKDKLSFGGRQIIVLPVYYYVFAGFSLIFPGILPLKFLSNIISSLLPIIIYAISTQLVKKRDISLLSALLAAFIPILSKETVNSLNNYSLTLDLIFLFLYLYLVFMKEKRNIDLLLATLILLVFTNYIGLNLIAGLIIYVIISNLEKVPVERREYEFIFFGILFFLWTYFIVFKRAFQIHGLNIIWQNVPSELLGNYFARINLIEIIYAIGILPLIFGIITVQSYVFNRKSKSLIVTFGLFCSTFLSFWFKLISVYPAIIFLGASLIVLSIFFLKELFIQIRKSKFAKFEKIIFVTIIIIAASTSVLPSILYMKQSVERSYDRDMVEPYIWLNKNTKEDSVILGGIEEGNLINYFGSRKNVIDTNYLLIEDINLIYNDTKTIYKASEIDKFSAIRNINKYDIDYILLSEFAKKEFNISKISYANQDCIELVFNKSIKIYKSSCRLVTN